MCDIYVWKETDFNTIDITWVYVKRWFDMNYSGLNIKARSVHRKRIWPQMKLERCNHSQSRRLIHTDSLWQQIVFVHTVIPVDLLSLYLINVCNPHPPPTHITVNLLARCNLQYRSVCASCRLVWGTFTSVPSSLNNFSFPCILIQQIIVMRHFLLCLHREWGGALIK